LTFASNEGNLPPSALGTVRLEVSSARRKHAGGHAETIGEAARPMTAYLLEALPGPVLALVCVLVFVGYAVAVTAIGRRLVPLVGRGHNEVGSVVLATVGVVYAVLLVSAVIALWERRVAVADHAANEASDLIDAYRDARALADPGRTAVQAELTRYVRAVIDHGYPALRGGYPSAISRQEFIDVFAAAQSYTPQNSAEDAWYRELLRELNSASAERALRIGGVSGSLPNVFWVVLLVQTLLMLGLGAMVSMEHARHHLIFQVVFAAVVALLLFLAVILDRPFSGDYALGPEPFEQALDAFATIH
jgi:hypothetical protein